ncbi:MAG: aldo/keto reductase [Nocardioides sp.]
MQQRRVGHSGLVVSRLGLGTWGWGQRTDEHEAREQLSAFVTAGGSLVDTAAGYGPGIAEELLGSLIGTTVARDELVITTKAGLTETPHGWPCDVSRRAMLGSLEGSLRRLGTDHVDLWLVHDWSDAAPLEETLGALDAAVRSGMTRYVGISNYCGWQTGQAVTWQRAHPDRAPLVGTQVSYSLVDRRIEEEVLPAAEALGLGVFPWSPLGGGVLTGKYRRGTPADSRAAWDPMAESVERFLDGDSARVVEAVSRAADGLGWSPLQVALTWVRDRDGVTAPIVGARTAAQLAEALSTEDLVLPPEIADALTDVSAGARPSDTRSV